MKYNLCYIEDEGETFVKISKPKKDWDGEYKDKKRNKKAKKDYSEQRNRKRGEIQD